MEEKIDWLIEHDEEILTADGFDYALIGVCERAGQPTIAMYDKDKCINQIDVLMWVSVSLSLSIYIYIYIN